MLKSYIRRVIIKKKKENNVIALLKSSFEKYSVLKSYELNIIFLTPSPQVLSAEKLLRL